MKQPGRIYCSAGCELVRFADYSFPQFERAEERMISSRSSSVRSPVPTNCCVALVIQDIYCPWFFQGDGVPAHGHRSAMLHPSALTIAPEGEPGQRSTASGTPSP